MSVFSVLHYAAEPTPGDDHQTCRRCGAVLQAGGIAAWREGTPVVAIAAGAQVMPVPYEGVPEGAFFPSCAPAARFGDSGGPVVALEPSTETEHPLRASDVPALLAKNIA